MGPGAPERMVQVTKRNGWLSRLNLGMPMDIQLFAEGDKPPATGNPAETFSREYVQDLRNEAAEYRTKLRAAETARDEALSKHKTAEEGFTALLGRTREVLKLDAKADAATVTQKLFEALTGSDSLTKRAQEALLKAAFLSAAGKANLIDSDAAFKLANLKDVKVDLESMSVYPMDKDGKQVTKDGKPVTGVDDIITTLVKDKPYLAGKAGGTSVGGGSNPGNPGAPDPIEAAKKLAEERNKRPSIADTPGALDPWAPPK